MKTIETLIKESPNDDRDGELYKQVMASKPVFASNAEALSHYESELEGLAANANKSVHQLVVDADDSEWSAENRRIIELSTLILALRSNVSAQKA